MSFRSEAANVRSKLASGAFEKANPDPYGFKGFADQVTFGIRAEAEKRRQEELMEKKEEFARKRAAAAKQAAKDEQDRKNSSLANLYLSANKMDVTPTNRTFVLDIISSGGIDNLTDLNTMMEKYTTYTPGATTELPTNSADQAPPFKLENEDGSTDTTLNVDGQTQEMLDLSPQQTGDKPTETVQESGTLSFSGAKEDQFDLSKLTSTNWMGYLRTAELAGNKPNMVAQIKDVAARNGWDNTINGVNISEMAGKGSSYFDDLLATVDQTSQPSEHKFLLERKAQAQLREADPNWYDDPTKIVGYSYDTLGIFLGSGDYEEGSDAYKKIDAYRVLIGIKEGKARVEDLVGKDSKTIDQAIKAFGSTLDTATLSTLTDMRTIAEEFENRGEEFATPKLQAMKAYKSFHKVDTLGDNERMEKMADFEKAWSIATAVDGKTEWWTNAKTLAETDPIVLQTILDAGLAGAPDSDMYVAIQQTVQAKTTNLDLEATDATVDNFMNGVIGKPLVEIDQQIAANTELLAANPDLMADVNQVRSLRESFELGNEKFTTAKEAALTKWREENITDDMTSEQVVEAYKKFEREWAAGIKEVSDKPYTADNYASDLIKYGEMAASDDPVKQEQAKIWTETKLPIIEASLSTAANLNEEARIKLLESAGVDRTRAIGLINNAFKTATDPYGNVQEMNYMEGTITPLTVKEPVGGDEAQLQRDYNALLAAAINEGQGDPLNLNVPTQIDLEGNGKEYGFASEIITITPEDKRAALEYIRSRSGPIANADNLSSAFGVTGWYGQLANTIAGVANETIDPQAQEAISAMKAFRTMTTLQLVTAFPGIRDSASLKAQLISLIPEPAKIGTGVPQAVSQLKALKGIIDGAITDRTNSINGGGIVALEKSKSRVALASLKPLSTTIGIAISDLEKQLEGMNPQDNVGKNESIFKPTPQSRSSNYNLPSLNKE